MSGKDGDAKLSTDSGKPTKKKGNSWPLWVGGALTITFAVLIFVLLRARLPEWFPIDLHSLPAGEEPPQLTLSEIGNVLAGIFAPLAFLWLFVATMLQRQELELQREELQETREVLRKTAEANDAQAELMRGSLEMAQKSNEYEYFSLNLYYIAAAWWDLNRKIFLPTEGGGFVKFGKRIEHNLALDKTQNVDNSFKFIHDYLVEFNLPHDGHDELDLKLAESMIIRIVDLLSMIKNSTDIYYLSNNPMVRFRYEHISGEKIYLLFLKLYEECFDLLIKQFPEIEIPPPSRFVLSYGATP